MKVNFKDVGIEEINDIVTGIDMLLRKQEERDRDKVFDDMHKGKSNGQTLSKITEKYKKIRNSNPILRLSDNLTKMNSIANKKHELDNLEELIKQTGEDKSVRIIGKVIQKYRMQNQKIYDEAKKIMENDKVKRPITINEDEAYFVKYVNITGDGFDINNVDQDSRDGYLELFRVAFRNQNNDLYKSYYNKEEKTITTYVESEIEEIEDLKKFWQRDEFKDYIKGLEEEDPKKAHQYKTSQLKRVQEVKKVIDLYEKLSKPLESKEKIQEALNGLRAKKAIIPQKDYDKLEKRLLKQREKENKKVQKIEKKVSGIVDKVGIKHSINNAKEFANTLDEIDGLQEIGDKRQKLERKITSILEMEVETTIKGNKKDLVALKEGEYQVKEDTNSPKMKRDISFAQPYNGVDHNKAQEKAIEGEKAQEKTEIEH